MNKLKLGLSNFQSISDGELEFETGLNFIIGQSNSGKSATFRALKACLSNPSGSQRFIKKGHSCAEVSLEYNGNVIIWKRTKSESSYEINGEKYVKTGKSDAFKILDNVGFARDFNDNIMNIEEELQLPFPYGISKFDLFKLFENVFCVSDSAIILKSAKEQENQVKEEIILLESDLSKTQKKIEELEKFKSEIDFDKLNAFKDLLVSKKNRIEFLNDGIDIIQKAVKVSSVPIPKVKKFHDLSIGYSELKKVKDDVEVIKKLHKLLGNLKEIKSPQKIDIRDYRELSTLLNNLNKVKELDSIKLPAPFITRENLILKRNELLDLEKTVKKLKKLHELKLPNYSVVNLLNKYNDLRNYLGDLEKIITRGRALTERKSIVQEKVKALSKRIKEYKVCPLCHRPIEN